MNVLEMLNQELKGKNWSLEEKARYLYLRSCDLFVYDPRIKFCSLADHGKELAKQIRNRVIDLENVEDPFVVCTSHANYVFGALLQELLNAEIENGGKGHAWTFFYDGERKISADATNTSDLTRVKMGLHTNYSYVPVIEDIKVSEDEYLESYRKHLKQIDQKIGYIKDEYEDYFIEKLKNEMCSSFVQYSYPKEVLEQSDDFFIYQLYTLKEKLESYPKIQSFSDVERCISYLMLHLLSKDYVSRMYEIQLFQTSYDDTWNFINLYPVQLENEILYFMLEESKNGCDFYEITESDAKHYIKHMDGLNKEIFSKF